MSMPDMANEHDVVHAEERVARAQLPLEVERRHLVALHHLGHRLDQLRDRRQVVLAHAEEIRAPDDAVVGLEVDEQQRARRSAWPTLVASGRFIGADHGADRGYWSIFICR